MSSKSLWHQPLALLPWLKCLSLFSSLLAFIQQSVSLVALRGRPSKKVAAPVARVPERLAFGVGSAWLGDREQQEKLKRTVLMALEAGVRHLDLAEAYHNSHVVGEAIQEWLKTSGSRREELFITNKVISLDHDIAGVCDQLLQDCKVDYFDLFLVHCVVSEENEAFQKPLPKMWEEMMQIKAMGKAKEIGVSNWRIEDLQSIKHAAVQPACNQVEAHPLLQQRGLSAYCQKHGIKVMSYGSLAPLSRTGALEAAPELRLALERIAQRRKVTMGQVSLRWAFQTSAMVVTTTSNRQRMDEYLGILGFELTEDEVDAISSAGMRSTQKRFTWPKCVGEGKFWDANPLTEVESQEWHEYQEA